MRKGPLQQWRSSVENMQSEASFTPHTCNRCDVKPTQSNDKEEAVPCDDEESVLPHHQDQTPYPVVFHDALRERREMTQWTKPGSYSEWAGGKEIQGMNMEQQKQQKAV